MHSVLETHALWMIATFILGYFLITIEHQIRVEKAAIALLMGVFCWLIQFVSDPSLSCIDSVTCLGAHLSSITQVIFFLLGALAIVELINSHNGFAIIADSIRFRSKKKLFWVVGILAFFLSSVLDNLTTTIVMLTLLGGLIDKGEDRWLIGGGVVIAANAGGAWTPIGDVTTTMLWIGGQVSVVPTIRDLFLPSLVSMVVAFLVLSQFLKGEFDSKQIHLSKRKQEPMGAAVFFLGISLLLLVPILKMTTGLPPFMGVLFGLGLLWLFTDFAHRKYQDREHLRMPSVLTKIDVSGLLFFLGILLAISALESANVLDLLAGFLNREVGNTSIIAALIGLASAIVDNVPLVAASMGMYSLEAYPTDHHFWQMIAYCAGTGGSILIIGSAAGVVYMGLEKVSFLWYLKRISLAAIVGYFAGMAVYLLF